jgi:hypothetical protein
VSDAEVTVKSIEIIPAVATEEVAVQPQEAPDEGERPMSDDAEDDTTPEERIILVQAEDRTIPIEKE